MHTITHSHRAIYPLLDILGSMPAPGQDIELLVKHALEEQAVKEEKEINVSFQLLRTQDGRLTGEVELFPFSPLAEESYLEEQFSKYADDPLYWELAQEPQERYYQALEMPGGDNISYLIQKKGQIV